MTRKMITAMLCALLCLPMVAGAASTPISQTPDAGTLTGTEKIPIGRVGGTTAISTTTGALLNRANHTGTQAATTVAEDSTHRFATDAEKSTWNAKQDAYSVLTTLGGLSHASGWLKNDGAGVLSYATPAKADLGLGNVDNTSDASKPISSATQTALNAKQALNLVDTVTGTVYRLSIDNGVLQLEEQ